MPLEQIDHYAIRTSKLEESREFYEDLLGLSVGDRPEFPFPGHWLYIGDHPVVHLVGIDEDDPQGLYDYLGVDELGEVTGGGAVDHVAFVASDAAGLKAKLETVNLPFRERTVPNLNLKQIFVEDPNEITVELNYYDS